MNRYSVLIAVVTLYWSCGKKTEPASSLPGAVPVSIEGKILRTTTISEAIQVSGTLIPFEETVLQPEVSGRVVQINLPEGRAVAKGALLVKIYDGELQAQLKKLQVQLDIARATEARQKQLLEINGISQQEYDLSLLSVKNLESEIELIKVQIGRTELHAPFAGTIGLKQISVGAYVSPATTVATLRQINKLKLDFSVPEKYGREVKSGQKI
ncbi:MAG: efflux RND transporter periplasmic adaptor subunit, partial [Bacteroidetes bacterium]